MQNLSGTPLCAEGVPGSVLEKARTNRHSFPAGKDVTFPLPGGSKSHPLTLLEATCLWRKASCSDKSHESGLHQVYVVSANLFHTTPWVDLSQSAHSATGSHALAVHGRVPVEGQLPPATLVHEDAGDQGGVIVAGPSSVPRYR